MTTGVRLLRAVLLLAWAVCLGAQGTTVVLVRHAERISLFEDDSPLSEAGQRRAQTLGTFLAAYHPVALYASDRMRTQQTVAPLAARLGLKPTVRPKEESSALAADILKNHRGQTVLVCWHHDLMKKLAKGLGMRGPLPYWSLDAYDPIWIVRISIQGEATLEERTQSSPVPSPDTAK